MLGGAFLCRGRAAGLVSVDASWLDASSAGGGVACQGGAPASARFVARAGGAFVAGGVVDADGSVAALVTIEPVDATAPAGETGGPDVPGDGTGGSSTDANPAAGGPTTGPTEYPTLKPAAATTKTTTTVAKTTASTSSGPKTVSATAAATPKTEDNNWIAASFTLLLLGIVLLGVAYRY